MKNQKAVLRIKRMEHVYNGLCHAVKKDRRAKKLYKRLARYYDGGKWMADYVLDEKGLLPSTLKRGVLSEDGVYNLLTKWENPS